MLVREHEQSDYDYHRSDYYYRIRISVDHGARDRARLIGVGVGALTG